jgi:hypothetical protein
MHLIIAVLSLLGVGCVSVFHFETPDQVAAETKITYDKIKKETVIIGPLSEGSQDNIFYWMSVHFIEKEFLFCQLGVYEIRGLNKGPAYYYEAFDVNQNKFKIIRMQYGEDEKIGIDIPLSYLRYSEKNGMALKLNGEKDNLMVKIDAIYIEGVLQKVKEQGFTI